MISVVDYGLGNLTSVKSALKRLNIPQRSVSNPRDVLNSKAVILPGVGCFSSAVQRLKEQKLFEPITKIVNEGQTPFLGICLGMQLLFEGSLEGGRCEGFAALKGWVKPLSQMNIGWKQLEYQSESPLFKSFKPEASFYFNHVFALENSTDDVNALTHDLGIVASVNKQSIYGVQFHPERSQGSGLRVLRNFANLSCSK